MESWQQKVAFTRDVIEPWHNTPTLKVAIACAVVEAAEALDAVLRIEGGLTDRTRPNDKKDSIERELAQTLYMVCTAATLAGETVKRWTEYEPVEDPVMHAEDLVSACIDLTHCYNAISSRDRFSEAAFGVCELAQHYGVDIDRELGLWLAELRGRGNRYAQP